MTPQDQEFIFAKVDAKMADLRGDVRMNTQGLSELKARFDDLAKRMADVPTNVATITERVSHLPTKDELGTKLRNYMLLGVALVGMIVTVATFAMKFTPSS